MEQKKIRERRGHFDTKMRSGNGEMHHIGKRNQRRCNYRYFVGLLTLFAKLFYIYGLMTSYAMYSFSLSSRVVLHFGLFNLLIVSIQVSVFKRNFSIPVRLMYSIA